MSADNRMIFHPYPKYVNAVMDVDMAAAVIVTDAATARRWGLAPDEVAYVSGWADAHDIWYLSQRPVLHRSPALLPIPGTSSITHLDENLAASSIRLSTAEFEALSEH